MRLDVYLVENGYFESRNRALEAIKSGKVRVGGKSVKPSFICDEHCVVEVENEKFYTSRAGRKLEAFLAECDIDLKGKTALDVGSSTGGFAQILLEGGVSALSCVDVGSNQLHSKIKEDARVTAFEQTDIRDFVAKVFDVVSCDVSFISLLEIIDALNRFANSDIILLYKPQFEVGKDVRRDSRGVVLDKDAIRYNMQEFEKRAMKLEWKLVSKIPSKIKGKEGNEEYFYHFKKVQN